MENRLRQRIALGIATKGAFAADSLNGLFDRPSGHVHTERVVLLATKSREQSTSGAPKLENRAAGIEFAEQIDHGRSFANALGFVVHIVVAGVVRPFDRAADIS